MKTPFIVSIIGLSIFIACGCEKNESHEDTPGKVELYLIHSYSRIDNTQQIDENSVVIEKKPFLYYSDFLSYDSTYYIFELSDRATSLIKDIKFSSYGTAFAVKANDTLIYTGYFWSGYSSLSCDWVVIDPLTTYSDNVIQVNLGYPFLLQGQTIPDKRNDKRIIRIFKQDQKLKEAI